MNEADSNRVINELTKVIAMQAIERAHEKLDRAAERNAEEENFEQATRNLNDRIDQLKEQVAGLKADLKWYMEENARLRNLPRYDQPLSLYKLGGIVDLANVLPFAHPDGKIATIKIVRDITNCSLLDAKHTVDSWVDAGRISWAEKPAGENV